MTGVDIAKAPPEGDSDGAEEGHSRAASDSQENKPNGHCPQADSAPASAFGRQTLFTLSGPGALVAVEDKDPTAIAGTVWDDEGSFG
jgi:hypothetical protein